MKWFLRMFRSSCVPGYRLSAVPVRSATSPFSLRGIPFGGIKRAGLPVANAVVGRLPLPAGKDTCPP